MPRLLDQVREMIRYRHYSLRTEKVYVHWIREYILFHSKRHPAQLETHHITEFLSHLAVQKNVAAATQNQAASALLFLYREVLGRPLENIGEVKRARMPERLPTVFTRDEVKVILAHLDGTKWLMASLLYGAGLRLMECLRLRVKDIDFSTNQITIREGKGNKDRVTMLPRILKDALKQHLLKVKLLHEQDLRAGFGSVNLPHALAHKYKNAERELAWQYLFPASKYSTDLRTGKRQRHHLHESVLQRAVKNALRAAQINKPGKLPHLSS